MITGTYCIEAKVNGEIRYFGEDRLDKAKASALFLARKSGEKVIVSETRTGKSLFAFGSP